MKKSKYAKIAAKLQYMDAYDIPGFVDLQNKLRDSRRGFRITCPDCESRLVYGGDHKWYCLICIDMFFTWDYWNHVCFMKEKYGIL